MSVSIPPLLFHEVASPSSRMHDQAAQSATKEDAPAAAGRATQGASAVTDGDRLRYFLDRRGMEVGFVVDPETGSSRMVVVDTTTGRTVLEIPAGSSLESAAKEAFVSRENIGRSRA